MLFSQSDRNVLFGVLALQMEFITQAGLIAALQAWTLQKLRPLGELLVELGHMSAEDRAALEPMVDRHVARHGGNAEQSLAALSSVSNVAAEMLKIDDDVLQQTIKYLQPSQSNSTKPVAASQTTGRDQTQQRFELLRAHAEGGLGKVWVAKDRELNREVAFKEIKPGHAEDLSSRGRFVLEAEITGGLEHPGIVPIYSLGHHENGRPFYAMRFICGDTLKEALESFHATAKKAAPRAEQDNFASVEFRQQLGRFVDVCHAIEYAHSRGVLHRDLKPGNIMLGKYGETLVVDWLLAKAAGKAERFATTERRCSGTRGKGLTQRRKARRGRQRWQTKNRHLRSAPLFASFAPPRESSYSASSGSDLPESDVLATDGALPLAWPTRRCKRRRGFSSNKPGPNRPSPRVCGCSGAKRCSTRSSSSRPRRNSASA